MGKQARQRSDRSVAIPASLIAFRIALMVPSDAPVRTLISRCGTPAGITNPSLRTAVNRTECSQSHLACSPLTFRSSYVRGTAANRAAISASGRLLPSRTSTYSLSASTGVPGGGLQRVLPSAVTR